MKPSSRVSESLRGVGRMLGRPGLVYFLIGAAASVLLSAIEYAIAIFLIMFLYALGITTSVQVPQWLPIQPESIPVAWIWACMLGIALLQSVARIASFQSKVLLMGTVDARMKMVLGYLLLKKDSAHPMPTSEVDFLLTECFPKASSFVFHFTQTFSFAIQVALMTSGMLFLAFGEALTGIAGLGVMALVVLLFNRMAQRVAHKVPESGAKLHRIKTRSLRNWMLIKVLHIQDREYRGFIDAVHSGFRHNALAYLLANLSLAVMPVVGVLVLAAIVTVNVQVFHTPTAEFAAFIYLYIRLQQNLSNGANMMGDLFTSRHQFKICLDMVDSLSPEDLARALRPEPGFRFLRTDFAWPAEPAALQDAPAAPIGAPPDIAVQGIGFGWPTGGKPVFEDLSFRVPAGSQFAIVGPNGCGKSSLLGCLLGIYRPTNGQVTIGSLDAATYFERHAARMAYVGAEPYLVQGSLRDNLIYGLDTQLDDSQLWQALVAVRMDDWVRTLPVGLDYLIAENGDGLSSGQRQRLTIARAFLRSPTLLVMDEPSANVDEASELAIADALRELKGRCTVVVVSHKTGILREADYTLNLDTRSCRVGPAP